MLIFLLIFIHLLAHLFHHVWHHHRPFLFHHLNLRAEEFWEARRTRGGAHVCLSYLEEFTARGFD